MRFIPQGAAAVFALAWATLPAPAQELSKEGVEFFESKVRPILVDNCYECHSGGAKILRSGLRLDLRDGLLKGGESGKPAIVPGQPEASRLIRAVKRTGPEDAMPPREEKKLTPQQVADLEAWIRMGAPDPRTDTAPQPLADPAAKAKDHWAFKKPQDPPVPAVKNASWVKSPIDAFVLAKLEEKGLSPAQLADKRTLIRRATFDLHGLPPTPEEVDAFVADGSPDAFAKVIDRLLASPRYGERWGRHWLDLARYADTKGYVFEEERRYPFSYTYRDWVIAALNEDLPYDQFLIRQIAADRLPLGDDKRPLAAMGFLTVGRRFLNNPADIIDDQIDVIARGTMALTVGCARCHDHKFDPIPIKDYYSLYGVFSSSREMQNPPSISTPQQDEAFKNFEAERAKLQGEVDAYLNDRFAALVPPLRTAKSIAEYLTAVYEARTSPPGDFRSFIRDRELSRFMFERYRAFLDATAQTHHPVMAAYHQYAAIAPAEFAAKSPQVTEAVAKNADPQKPLNPLIVAAFVGKPPPASMREVADRYGELLAAADKPEPHADANQEALRAVLRAENTPTVFPVEEAGNLLMRDERNRLRDLRKKLDELQANHAGAPPRPMALEDAPNPANVRVFLRGNPGNPGDEVPRQFLGVLAGNDRKPFTSGSGRLELAQAVASADNPLTARVMVNRVWLHHFGAGLVTTPSDFGLRSDPPSHPELLDWLAVRFVESGWSLKKLHRLVMLSATYQQDSTPADAAVATADPENRLLSHFNRRRLDFEAMRDALLYVTGRMDFTVGGKGVDITAEPFTARRTAYAFIERQNLPGIFRTFDFASPDAHSPGRFNTTVPQQALFMLNSPFAIQQAKHLTARQEVGAETDPAKRVERLYRLLFGRQPTPEEVAMGVEFVGAENTQGPPQVIWQYGYGQYDPGAQRVMNFTRLPHFTGTAWQGGPKLPDDKLGWLSLWPDGGHPGQGEDRAVVRRWTAPADGALSIDGHLKHDAAQGNGVQARIVSGRSGELAAWAVHNSEAQTKLDRVEVKSGDTIDFVVDSRGEVGFDDFVWSPALRLQTLQVAAAGDEGAKAWNAAKDFAGPGGDGKLSPWEKYAQVLLLSNEFMFVD